MQTNTFVLIALRFSFSTSHNIIPSPGHLFYEIFMRNEMHCISPYAIVVCVCVSVCLICLCVCVCMPRLWTSGKWFEIDVVFFLIAQNNTGYNL